MPTLTINITAALSPLATGGISIPGHIWYTLTANNGVNTSYGFAPDANHHLSPWAPGQVYNNDNAVYKRPFAYTRTISITQDQYERFTMFGSDVEVAAELGFASAHGFSTWYNGAANSCVDFVWQRIKGVSIAILLEQPCHVAHALTR